MSRLGEGGGLLAERDPQRLDLDVNEYTKSSDRENNHSPCCACSMGMRPLTPRGVIAAKRDHQANFSVQARLKQF